MKKPLAILTSLALLAGSAAPALAQQYDPHRMPPGQEHHEEHDNWRKGYQMRHDDWDHGRRVDWHEHHLRQPPRGYEWREVDGRFVLAAIATGIIADIILNAR